MKHARQTPGRVQVQVKGNHVAVTPALHDQVVQKMAKLDKYLDKLQTIEVELCWENTRDADHHSRVEATTHVTGRTLRVTASHSDMYTAIDNAVDKLYRQLNRQKERMKAHHSAKVTQAIPDETPEPVAVDRDSLEEPSEDPVILTERLGLKPMFEDEAVSELQSGGHVFYVFLNARNEQVNVLYRHGDGSYGLIEPQAS